MAPFYALGVNVARQVGGELKTILTKDEISAMLDGFSDSMTNKIDNETDLLKEAGPQLNEILTGRAMKAVEAEKEKGKDFASSFLLSHPKAQQTSSGLIYDEILAGVGPKPTAASTVEVHYHGTLTDGTVFDSSVDRGEPIKFPLSGVIPAWQEGVQLMAEGTKATLVCPSTIAYGDNGSPPVIPPGATLIFEVTLLKVVS
jgi:FKBP-type peptidyl-prolyl cis-trans isomerase FkpA/FKBP-type peptidyl-prolyl cis-trans isomerase FklB